MTSPNFNQGVCPEVQVRHRLRIAREHAGYDQGQLADLIGVSRNTVSNAETGAVAARKIVVNAWAMACGVPASWIWTGEAPDTDPGKGPDDNIRTLDYKDRVSSKDATKIVRLRPPPAGKLAG